MALTRPLERPASHRVLVVGGGIAGLQAALDLAAVGLPVTLAEAGPALGGRMAQLDKTFPTNDCSLCILSPKMLEAARHPLIEILTLTRLVDLQGEAGNFRAFLAQRPRYVEVERCSGCGECTRVCPRSLPDPYNLGLSPTKAIHVPYLQAVPQAAYIEPEACRLFEGKPCEACLQVCAPGAIQVHQQAQLMERAAGAVILATGTRPAAAQEFPGVAHPDVVTSLEFERLLSATGPKGGKLLRLSDGSEPRTLAFIQCVGSRDLRSAAYCSSYCCLTSLKGALASRELTAGRVNSTLFYLDLRAQGKGCEDYLERARSLGVRLVRARVTRVDPRNGHILVRYADLHGRPREEAFDLAVLSMGLRPPAGLPDLARRLKLGLNDHGFIQTWPTSPALTTRPGVLVCGTAREPMDIPETVTTASAAAQVASQLLALSPRRAVAPAKIPPPDADLGAPLRIGVFLCHCGTNIAKAIDLERLAESLRGLPQVALVDDFLFACSADSTRHLQEAIAEHGLNRIVVAACTPRTHEALFREVLAGARLNPGYLSFANIREQCSWVHQADPAAALETACAIVGMAVSRAAVLAPIQVQGQPVVPRALVLGGGVAGMSAALGLADQGFHTYLVERERELGGVARRLHFTLEGADPQELVQHLQSAVYRHPNVEVWTRTEALRLEGRAGHFTTRVRRQTPRGRKEAILEHGVVLMATGGREFSPQGRYLYGADPRVLTQLELEDRIQTADPELTRVRRVVMIQCVGSREPERPYCSRLCCAEALKNALLLKERYPLAEVAVLYRDLRAFGFREAYYQKAKEKGVEFIPFEADRPPQLAAPRRRPLQVHFFDELLNEEVSLKADLVVLSAGVEPASDRTRLGQQLGLPLATGGFYLEAHQKLRPVDTVAEGVFLCGMAHYPKSLGEAVAQAQAAALKAAGLLYQAEIVTGEVFAAIDPGRCSRCLACVESCPYGAVRLTLGGRPEVAPQSCRGCGICAAGCPAMAISLNRDTEAEITAQIRAALR